MRRIALVIAPVVLGTAAVALFLEGPERRGSELMARGIVTSDLDNDGVSDTLERVLGTRLDLADTDLDGYGDLQELAQQTDPLDINRMPSEDSPLVGMAGFTSGNVLHMLTAVLVPSGDIEDVTCEFGIERGGVLVPIPTSALLALSSIDLLETKLDEETLVVFSTAIPEGVIHALGGTTAYCKVSQTGQDTTAAVLQMISLPGIDAFGQPFNVLVRPEEAPDWLFPRTSFAAGGGSSVSNTSVSPPTADVESVGTIYRPLIGDERVPTDWTPGQVCFQEMTPVGSSGISVVFQVDSASCEAFDTFCSPGSCGAALGEEVSISDPGAVIGG